MRKKLTALITVCALAITCFAVPVSAASSDYLIHKVGSKNKSVKVGQEFELRVTHGRYLDDDMIKWTSSNTSVVRYADDDRYDNEMEFRAVKKGKATITVHNRKTGGKLYYYVTVKSSSGNNFISRIGDKNRSVKAGQEFELRVSKGTGLHENDIKWTSSNTSVVRYDDDDRYDNEMEFQAVKSGKSTITATNLETGGKVYFYVTVKANSGSIYISRIGSATRYVEADDDLELRVSKGSGLKNSDIKWSISNDKLRFEDGYNYGSYVELEAGYSEGKAIVTAKNLKTGGTIKYTVYITPEYDD